jgi:hypothetical protein
MKSSSRRLLLLGVLVAAGALTYSVLERRDTSTRSAAGRDFGICATKQGDAARACYSREVGRELAAVGGTTASLTSVSPSDSAGEVTFAAADVETAQQDPLLCELHARVGVTNGQVPPWIGWSEPLAEAAPVS